MLIDKSKMAVDSSFSFLNLRKHHTNLKLKLLFKIETQTLSLRKVASLNFLRSTNSDRKRLSSDRPDSDRALHTLSIDQFRSPYGYTCQKIWQIHKNLANTQLQIHKFGKIAYETNI